MITDSGRVAEAKLIKKYKGICFFDDDEDEGGYFRIRSGSLHLEKVNGRASCVIRCLTKILLMIPPNTQKLKKKGFSWNTSSRPPSTNDNSSTAPDIMLVDE